MPDLPEWLQLWVSRLRAEGIELDVQWDHGLETPAGLPRTLPDADIGKTWLFDNVGGSRRPGPSAFVWYGDEHGYRVLDPLFPWSWSRLIADKLRTFSEEQAEKWSCWRSADEDFVASLSEEQDEKFRRLWAAEHDFLDSLL